MPQRTLPTRDLTMPGGARLYYKGDLSQRLGVSAHGSLYESTRAAGNLHVVLTIDETPKRGEHYHLSISAPDRTPAAEELVAVCRAFFDEETARRFSAVDPAHNPHSMQGHVVHLFEDTEQFRADQADRRHEAAIIGEADGTVSVHGPGRAKDLKHAAAVQAALAGPTRPQRRTDQTEHEVLVRAVHEELGLSVPFTVEEFAAAFDRVYPPAVRARHRPACTTRQGRNVTIPVPSGVRVLEEAFHTYHGLMHVALEHAADRSGRYTAAQEEQADLAALAMMTYSLCGQPDDSPGAAGDTALPPDGGAGR